MASKANTAQVNIPLGEIRNRFWEEFKKYFKDYHDEIIKEFDKINIGKFILDVNVGDPHVMQVYSYKIAGLKIHLSTNSVSRYMEVHLIYFHNGNHTGTNGTEHFVINKIHQNICENKIHQNICENKIKTLLNNENDIVNLVKRENSHSYDTLYYIYNEYSIRDENKWSKYFPVLSETIVHFLNNSQTILKGIV